MIKNGSNKTRVCPHCGEILFREVRRMIARNTDFTFPRIQYSCYPEKRCKCATFTCEYME